MLVRSVIQVNGDGRARAKKFSVATCTPLNSPDGDFDTLKGYIANSFR